jgi:immunoglobulin-binding protein 1
VAYERYLSILSHYEILSEGDKKLYREYTENPVIFSTISTTDFGARRAAKIANFQQERDLKKKLEVRDSTRGKDIANFAVLVSKPFLSR